MDSDQDLYQILQIDPAAEQEVVQAAFKRLALKYHPDTNPSPGAHRRMQELNEAYAVISDPAQRAAYDVLRQEKLKARRQAEEQAHYQAAAERRAEAARQRKEQAAAQRRAENERQAKARAAAAQRRVEYEQQIRAQQAAQRRAKHERQQREWEAEQAAAQAAAAPAAASIEAPVTEPVREPEAVPEAMPEAVPEARVWVEVEPSPIDLPRPSESERRQLALRQSQQALQERNLQVGLRNYGCSRTDELLEPPADSLAHRPPDRAGHPVHHRRRGHDLRLLVGWVHISAWRAESVGRRLVV